MSTGRKEKAAEKETQCNNTYLKRTKQVGKSISENKRETGRAAMATF